MNEGGRCETTGPYPLPNGCDYIIPQAFADKWKEALDRLNEDGVEQMLKWLLRAGLAKKALNWFKNRKRRT